MEFGLIGKSLQHSFSEKYFSQKFREEGLNNCSYQNFELERISDLPQLLRKHPRLKGLNVTVPYKESVIPYLEELFGEAKEIGAVNTIRVEKDKLRGFNTDFYGFCESLKPLLRGNEKKALILGTGGAAKAVKYTLKVLNISFIEVSRTPGEGQISYGRASEILAEFPLVINTTPLGTFPQTEEIPPLDLENVSENHLFYDLVYNPPETRFLREAKAHGARIKNGHEMLVLQAEKAWRIWQHI